MCQQNQGPLFSFIQKFGEVFFDTDGPVEGCPYHTVFFGFSNESLLTEFENNVRRPYNAAECILLLYQPPVLSLGSDSSNGTSLGSCPPSEPSGTLSFLLTGSTKAVMEPF
jgi:hypothetical protein